MIPSRRLLWSVVALGAAAIAASIFPDFQPAWIAAAAAFAVLTLLDAYAGRRLPAPALVRQVPGSLALGVHSDVRLRVANAAGLRVRLELFDHHPPSFESEGLPRQLDLGPLIPGASGLP